MKPPIFSIDFRKGSMLSDTNQPLLEQYNSPLIKGSKGYYAYQNKNDSYIAYNVTPYTDVTKPFSIVVNLDILKSNLYGQTFTMEGSNYSGFGVYGREVRLWNTYTIGLTYNYGNSFKIGNQSWIITYDGNKSENSLKFYINNIIQTKTSYTNNLTSDIIGSKSTFYIGRHNAAQRQKVYTFQMYDYVISEQQRQSLYQDFLDSKPIAIQTIFKPNLNIYKPHEIKEDGLIAAYNFQAIGNKIVNIAWDNPANGNNARQYDMTAVKTFQLSDGIRAGVGYIKFTDDTIKDFGNINTIHIVGKGNLTLLNQGGGKISVSQTSSTYYWDSSDHSSTQSKVWSTSTSDKYVITFVRNNLKVSVYVNGVYIGDKYSESNNGTFQIDRIFYMYSSGVNYGMYRNSYIYNFRVYNRVLTDQEIKSYHNQFASKIVLKEDFSQYPVGLIKLNSIKNTGWVLSELKSPLDNLKIGTKLPLTQGTGRWLVFPQKTRYGTFYFDMIIYSTSSANVIYFAGQNLKATASGYAIGFQSSDITRLSLKKDSTDILLTNFHVVSNKSYKVKIESYTNGDFKLYVDDKLVGQINNNDYTTSDSFKIESGSPGGFSITNIKIKQGIEV